MTFGMHIAHDLIHRRSQDLVWEAKGKSFAIKSSEIFEKRDFLWDKECKIRSWESGLARNQDFAKGEGLEPQVKKFYKYIKIGRRGEQISATQTYHRRGLGAEPPAAGGYRVWGLRHPAAGRCFAIFGKNSYFKVIWITFRNFQSYFK